MSLYTGMMLLEEMACVMFSWWCSKLFGGAVNFLVQYTGIMLICFWWCRTYYAAVIENRADFTGRVVVDVGAGSGILSLFAAQAGAKHVYAVEASEMAEYARKLIAGNPTLAQRITVIKGRVEDVELPEKADILISEPMGTLLVNERMLESYVIARDRFLTPTGKMFPGVGRIHMAPFTDEYLFIEIANKVCNVFVCI
ncbi:probable histone-arginine methyltransferase 1.3 [Lathyrus oleraceus]|nr:probable histone-arginine methyltransferase 1.3 [Pisum sativum]